MSAANRRRKPSIISAKSRTVSASTRIIRGASGGSMSSGGTDDFNRWLRGGPSFSRDDGLSIAADGARKPLFDTINGDESSCRWGICPNDVLGGCGGIVIVVDGGRIAVGRNKIDGDSCDDCGASAASIHRFLPPRAGAPHPVIFSFSVSVSRGLRQRGFFLYNYDRE